MSSEVDFRDLSVLNAFLRNATEDIGQTLPPAADWMPVAFVISSNRNMTVVPGTWTNDEEQHAFYELMVEEIIARGGVAVGMVVTIWMLKTEVAGEALRNEPRPRDHPLREEGLQVLTMSADKNLVAYATVTRSDNDPPKLGEWELEEGELEGVMTTLVKQALRKVKDV